MSTYCPKSFASKWDFEGGKGFLEGLSCEETHVQVHG